MTLEPKNIGAGAEEENAELRDMTRRFWIGAALSVPVFFLAMWHILPSAPAWVQSDLSRWAQFHFEHAGGALVRLAILSARLAIDS